MRRITPAALLAGVVGMTVSACGSSGSTDQSSPSDAAPTVTANASLGQEVPAAIRSKGTLVVAADASYAPNEFIDKDGKTVIGLDADLAQALGQELGIKVTVVNATFDSIIPGLSSGKFDLGMSSFTDTKEREKTVDFVTYFTAGTSFFTKAGSSVSVSTLDELCGHKVAVEKGTTQQDDATAQKKKCTDAGKGDVDVQVYPDQSGANTALSSGRADVVMSDSPVAAYQVQQSGGQFTVSGKPYGTAPYGIAIPKGNGMSKAVLDAIVQLQKDGTYKAILGRWGVSDGALDTPQVNGAQS